MLNDFEKHLRRENLSENTISAYLLTVRMYNQLSGEITKQNLLAFKGYLNNSYHLPCRCNFQRISCLILLFFRL